MQTGHRNHAPPQRTARDLLPSFWGGGRESKGSHEFTEEVVTVTGLPLPPPQNT